MTDSKRQNTLEFPYVYAWGNNERSYRWRWLAAFIAWERTRRGWFRYEVRS